VSFPRYFRHLRRRQLGLPIFECLMAAMFLLLLLVVIVESLTTRIAHWIFGP